MNLVFHVSEDDSEIEVVIYTQFIHDLSSVITTRHARNFVLLKFLLHQM